MLKKDKVILESLTRKYGKRNVVKSLNEAGDSLRGQYMLGRLERNRHDKDPHTSISAYRTARKYNDADEKMWKAYVQGWDDEGIDLPTLKRRNTKYNYEFHKNEDMDKIGKKFISFIEKNDAILQLIVDYMSGNQNGEKYSSPLVEIIPEFEDAVLKYETTPDEKKAIERAFNEWWHYAEAELMPEEYYGDIEESYRPRKSRKINEDIDTGQYMSAQERREIGAYRMQEENRKREKYAKHYKYINELRKLSDWIYDDCKVDVTDELVNAIHKIKISMK